MSAQSERTVLIVGDDPARVDRFVTPLRRASFSVRRVPTPAAAIKLVHESPFDAIVVVFPFACTTEFLAAVRVKGSSCLRTGVIVVSDEIFNPARAPVVIEHANRVLTASATPEELQTAAEALLGSAPRVAVEASARLHLQTGESRTAEIENLSSTGMYMKTKQPPAVGSVFGFELFGPSFDVPISGRAQVVRHKPTRTPGEYGVAASILSLTGDGAKLLESMIYQERAATQAKEWSRSGKSAPAALRGPIEIRTVEELAARREELADLEPYLEEKLRQGLGPRISAADWYLAAAALGLESLTAFSAIMEAVHSGRARRAEASQQIADLADVRRHLAEFVEPRQTVQALVEILLRMRQSLERLLRALALTGAFQEEETSGSRPRGLVAELALDVNRMLRFRRHLGQLPAEIAEFGRVKYLVARRGARQRADEVCKDFAMWTAETGLSREALLSRSGRKKIKAALGRELERFDKQLQTVHKKVYSGKFRTRASGDLDTDFAEAKIAPILVETLAAGSEFLVRAYSAYRHSLELTGTDPRLLDRVAGIAATIRAAEQRLGKASRPAAR
jgi:CheY-like chemotaxis protein